MNIKRLFILLIIVIVIRYILQWGYIQLLTMNAPRVEKFTDISQLLDPMPSSVEANESFRKVIRYLEKNPTDSGKFLTYIQSRFFKTACPFIDPSNWNNLIEGDMRVFKVDSSDEKIFRDMK
jgi:hypothetical protein